MASKKDNPMLDPIAYRDDYPEENIIGTEQANESFSAYGDDSDLAHQQQSLGGMNDKYGGEGVGVVNYNEDATLSNLPNYIYGKEANQTGIEGYLSKRNDNVASALFNEGKLTKEDVVNYLAQQQGWNNSSEMDRMNTVESIWKRIGNLQGNGEQKKETVDTSRMEQDLNKDTSGTIYGKTTAEEGDPKNGIDTLEDKNSVFQMMNNARITAVEEMISMGVDSLAAMQYSGTNPYNETNWRDFRKYYPDMAAQVDQKVKEMKGQDTVNEIASGKTITTTADKTDVSGQATSYAVNNASGSTSATQLLQGINSILESNDTAKSSEELMGSIEKDMATLKNKMKNLKSEASNIFKGDAPDYLVNAYINNKSQEIQNQLSILEDRYNAAYNRYKTELSHAERQAEYELKKDSLALEDWKAKNTTSSSSDTPSSQDGRMRTERNNNPTAMTTDYAKMMGLELGVDYEIGDSFIGEDGRTYYTAKFLGDPVETAIKAFDRGAANNVFANEGGVLGHWHLGISNQKWLSMTDKEKREVIDKILQKEGGKMDNMSYYLNNTDNDEKVTYNHAWEDMLRQIATGQVKLNSATAKSYAELMGTDVRGLGKMVEAYQADQLENGKAAGRDLLNIMAELQILFEDKGLDDGQFDTNAWQSLGWGSIGRKHDQLKEQLKLNKVTEARDKGATFGQMTEYEWKVLENAATSLNILKQDDKEYTDEFKKIMRATWIATFGKAPTEQERQDYVKQQRVYQNFNVSAGGSSSESEDDKLAQIGSGTVSTGVNFVDVVQNGR